MKRFAIGAAIVALSFVSAAGEAATFTFQYDAPGDGGGGCGAFVTGPTFSETCSGVGLTTTVAVHATLTTLKLFLDSGGTYPAGPEPFTEARLRITDTLTVTGGVGNGTLKFDWDLDGMLQAATGSLAGFDFSQGPGGGVSFAQSLACGAGVTFASCSASPATLGGNYPISVPIVFGTPVTVIWTLSAFVGHGCIIDNGCDRTSSVAASGVVDLSHTLQLQPLVVLDQNGAPVAGASAQSSSGFSYEVAAAASPVPEPTTMLLIATGVALGSFRRRFDKRQA